MASVKILAKGQLVIPADIRKRYNISPGSKMQIMEYDNLIYLVPPVDDPIKAACGLLPGTPSLSAKLPEERKKDFA